MNHDKTITIPWEAVREHESFKPVGQSNQDHEVPSHKHDCTLSGMVSVDNNPLSRLTKQERPQMLDQSPQSFSKAGIPR